MEPASQAVSYRRSHEQKKGQQMTSPRILKLRMRKQTRNKKKNKQAMRLKVLQHYRR